MSETTEADTKQRTVATFDNSSTGETVEVVGEVIDRRARYDWSNEIITVEDSDGMKFEFYMGDSYTTRTVKVNGQTVGNWTAFLN